MSDLFSKISRNYPLLKYALLEAQTFDENHFGFPEIYYEILENDQVRIDAFQRAFRRYNQLQDAVICEVGVGTLALTRLFLPFVKKAYLIESNQALEKKIRRELQKNGWEEKVELIFADARTVHLPEKVDFIIGELMSIYCANEMQVSIFRHLRKFLKPQGKLIPEKIINLVQLGHVDFDKKIKHYPIQFSRHLPTLMTTQEEVNIIDLYRENKKKIEEVVSLKSRLSGLVNCAYLNSWVQCVEGINFTGTDSLMPPTIMRINEPVEVKVKQTIKLSIEYEYGTSLDNAYFKII